MTCLTCGATLQPDATTCEVCGAPTNPALTDPEGPTDTEGPTGQDGSTDQDGPADPGSTGPGAAGPTQPIGATGPDAGPAPGPGSGGSWNPPPPSAPYGGYRPGPSVPPHPSGLSSEVRGWGIGAHLGGLIVGLASGGAFGFLAPLLVWLLKRDEHPFIDHHAKESLNFQLTVLLVVLGGAVLAVPAVIFGILTLGIGLILLVLLGLVVLVLWFVLPIVAAVKAGNGEGYRYPVVIRFVR